MKLISLQVVAHQDFHFLLMEEHSMLVGALLQSTLIYLIFMQNRLKMEDIFLMDSGMILILLKRKSILDLSQIQSECKLIKLEMELFFTNQKMTNQMLLSIIHLNCFSKHKDTTQLNGSMMSLKW